MTRQIALLGVDYRNATLAEREQLSFTPAEQQMLLRELIQIAGIGEAMLLCTCNRTELYVTFSGDAPVAPLMGALKQFRPEARTVCEESLHIVEFEERAVLHLFRVAAGVDSQTLGDTNIVMQVKQAFRTAVEAGTLGPLLDRTVSEALRASKRARRETAIGRGAASVGAAVLRTLRAHYDELSGIRALMLGGGEAGQDIARHLAKARFAEFTFSARNPDQADSMARAFSGTAIAWDSVPAHMGACEVVIAATPVRLPFLEKEALQKGLQITARNGDAACRDKRLLIIDAGVPRNADPEAATIPGVSVLDLDGFAKEGGEALAAREKEVPRVEAILGEEIERWRRWRGRVRSEPAEGNLVRATHLARSSSEALIESVAG